MIIVMPMAGEGSRFRDTGITTPKPMIQVLGEPMYAKAMMGLPLNLARKIVFICLKDHLDNHKLREDIVNRYGHYDIDIVSLERTTEGQAQTVLAAKHLMKKDEPVVIFNSDTTFTSPANSLLENPPYSFDGLLGVFEAEGDRWSFARIDSAGRVIETAEKKRISNLATTGLYVFSRSQDFVRYAEEAIASGDRERGEYYIAPLFNRMIEEGKRVVVERANRVGVMGTPEDLQMYLDQNAPHGEQVTH